MTLPPIDPSPVLINCRNYHVVPSTCRCCDAFQLVSGDPYIGESREVAITNLPEDFDFELMWEVDEVPEEKLLAPTSFGHGIRLSQHERWLAPDYPTGLVHAMNKAERKYDRFDSRLKSVKDKFDKISNEHPLDSKASYALLEVEHKLARSLAVAEVERAKTRRALYNWENMGVESSNR